MALERKLLTILPVPFTSNGTQFGVVTVADTVNFKDKQVVYLKSSTIGPAAFQIKMVTSSTQMVVGPQDNSLSINNYSDISAYLVADGATIGAGQQDKLAQPTDKDHYFAIYESSPVNADRVIPVDAYGNLIAKDNPLPVSFDGTISIGDVSIVEGGNTMTVNPDGSINVVISSAPSSTSSVVNSYNELINLASGVTASIVSYTVPFGKQSIFQRASFSGENIARYDLLINNVVQDTARTAYAGDYTGEFNWISGNDSGFLLHAGDVVKVQVYNFRPSIANFEGRIQVLEIIV